MFFDRGIIDILGYTSLINIEKTKDMINAAKSHLYNNKVFLFPYWKDIYCNELERRQNCKEAKDTYLYLKNEYEKFGYKTIDVPLLSIENRAKWILNELSI